MLAIMERINHPREGSGPNLLHSVPYQYELGQLQKLLSVVAIHFNR